MKGLKDVLSGEELLSIRAKDSDDMFRIRTMQRFVFPALKQQNSVMRYITPVGQDNQLTITFDPVVVAEQNEVRKTVLL
ncbi:hypothetical protein NE606_18040, partial [Agathobaculum butyriciproducens]|nr:hypothetical protein [Agathobaculum butyriciproducens]